MTVSTPFSAPAWPPDTGASTKLEAAFLGGGVEFTGYLGGRSRMVDENLALSHPGEGAVGTEGDFAQIVVIADTAT